MLVKRSEEKKRIKRRRKNKLVLNGKQNLQYSLSFYSSFSFCNHKQAFTFFQRVHRIYNSLLFDAIKWRHLRCKKGKKKRADVFACVKWAEKFCCHCFCTLFINRWGYFIENLLIINSVNCIYRKKCQNTELIKKQLVNYPRIWLKLVF